MSQQKYPKAYEAYQQAVYRDGRNPTFWCSIGVLYYQINQYRDALDAYSRAIRLNPYISEVWYDLGTLVIMSLIAHVRRWLRIALTPGSMSLAITRRMMPWTPTNAQPSSTPPTSTSKLVFHFCAMVNPLVFSIKPRRPPRRTYIPKHTRLLGLVDLQDRNGDPKRPKHPHPRPPAPHQPFPRSHSPRIRHRIDQQMFLLSLLNRPVIWPTALMIYVDQ